MIKKNNLTMKKLQEQINTLQSTSSNKTGTGTAVKWFILTAFITYACKIPFIAKIIRILKPWYGKTS